MTDPAEDLSIEEWLTLSPGAFIEPALDASKSPRLTFPELILIEPAEEASQSSRSAFTEAALICDPDEASMSMRVAIRLATEIEAPEDASMSSSEAVSEENDIFPADEASRLIFFVEDEMAFVHLIVAPDETSTSLTIGPVTVTVTPLIFCFLFPRLCLGYISSVLPLTFTSIMSMRLASPDMETLVLPPVVGL